MTKIIRNHCTQLTLHMEANIHDTHLPVRIFPCPLPHS